MKNDVDLQDLHISPDLMESGFFVWWKDRDQEFFFVGCEASYGIIMPSYSTILGPA
jgi:hypothetical protein